MFDILEFEAIARWDGNVAYAASMYGNALFEVNMLTGECSYICMFDESDKKRRLYTTAYKLGNKIYFIPASADRIAVYEPKEDFLYYLDIEDVDSSCHKYYNIKSKFNGGVVQGNYLYITPCTYPAILRINSSNDKIEYYKDWFTETDYMFRKSPYFDGINIYLPCTKNNLILKFNTENCRGNMFELPTKYGGWWSMCKIGDNFWLSPRKPGPIISWNEENNTVSEYEDYPSGFEKSDFFSTYIFEHNGMPYILPAFANMGLYIDIDKKIISPWTINGVISGSEVFFLFSDEDNIYLKIINNNKAVYRVVNKSNLYEQDFVFSFKNNKDKFLEDYISTKKNSTVTESIFFGLKDFLQVL